MNAYELADNLEYDFWHAKANTIMVKSADMLRQQADRIAELEKEKENYKYDPETGEPLIDGYPLFSGLPTPQIKHLSDEEINKLWAESHKDNIAMQQGFTTQQHYFAHLILKKASEK